MSIFCLITYLMKRGTQRFAGQLATRSGPSGRKVQNELNLIRPPGRIEFSGHVINNNNNSKWVKYFERFCSNKFDLKIDQQLQQFVVNPTYLPMLLLIWSRNCTLRDRITAVINCTPFYDTGVL
ncbi:unnamed protein product [Caenorhabditis angaria]|uniref:Uncharacterized protein n=1 Tax=Caenorhabditis angaria TaxID=860376 RepID=A0A9P1I407_9PELO|nr:unnamed protein product [Caenorhabditis angaria]